MKLLRNPEFRRELLLYAAITIVAAAIGFFIKAIYAALLLLMGVLFCALHIYFAHKRYRRMEDMSQRIDRILHGQEGVLIEDNIEGELSILYSELHKMTLRLKEQSDQLLADKIYLTEMIQDIFHQIRTPLTSLNLMTSMLGNEDLSRESRMQMMREMKRQLQRIQWLVETLLKLSKIDAGCAQFKMETVSVSGLLRMASEPLLVQMELKDLTLKFNIGDEHFNGDIDWTAEALGNILKDCMEHTPSGGTIVVRAAETALFTEIIIEDDGPGFAPKDIPHLFERFYKGHDASEESVGIGLALTQSVIAAQNGTIKAGNAPDGGASFVIRFYKTVI